MTARFIEKQPSVRMVNTGDGYYTVFICLNPREIIEENTLNTSSSYEETYIEYDYNEFKECVSMLNIDDINANPEKYLHYSPNDKINNMTLEEYKNMRQEENKVALEKFLSEQSVTYKNKQYGVSEEDQNEMALNLTQYQILSAAGQDVSLEWHSKKAKCETFTQEEFVNLIALIKLFVYPYYQKMQNIKSAIFNCKDKVELSAIEIKYE